MIDEEVRVDLILLQPGNAQMFPDAPALWPSGDSLIDPSANADWMGVGRCIELVSIQQGMKHSGMTGVPHGTRTNVVGPIVTEFTGVKYVDSLSVRLYDLCLRGESLDRGVEQPTRIHLCRNSGDKTARVLTFTLRDARITEIQLQSHPDDMPTEQFKLSFTEVLWTNNGQAAQGSPVHPVTAGWSLIHNRSISRFSDA
jgi:type VI secretion system secreted protein Hcp